MEQPPVSSERVQYDTLIQNVIDADIQPKSVPQDPRSRSRWLVYSKWIEHIGDLSYQDIHPLVESPKQDMPNLLPAVLAYFTSASAGLKEAPQYIAQRLNSPNPLQS